MLLVQPETTTEDPLEEAAPTRVGSLPQGAPGVPAGTIAVDRTGFDAFFQAEYPRLAKALYLVCGNRHEAEEVAQDAFVRAYERWHLVVRAENRPGYVYRIAVNLYRSKLRRASRAGRRTFRPEPEADPIEAITERDAIGRVLAGLTEGQREAVVLVEWLGMTDAEAGALLGISPVTVRVRIHRARVALRSVVERGDLA